nr:TPA_asm: nucleocapsid [Sclerotinia sclerotiorum negative-stranded RNA virus 5]
MADWESIKKVLDSIDDVDVLTAEGTASLNFSGFNMEEWMKAWAGNFQKAINDKSIKDLDGKDLSLNKLINLACYTGMTRGNAPRESLETKTNEQGAKFYKALNGICHYNKVKGSKEGFKPLEFSYLRAVSCFTSHAFITSVAAAKHLPDDDFFRTNTRFEKMPYFLNPIAYGVFSNLLTDENDLKMMSYLSSVRSAVIRMQMAKEGKIMGQTPKSILIGQEKFTEMQTGAKINGANLTRIKKILIGGGYIDEDATNKKIFLTDQARDLLKPLVEEVLVFIQA